jgi:hypothetical protein
MGLILLSPKQKTDTSNIIDFNVFILIAVCHKNLF